MGGPIQTVYPFEKPVSPYLPRGRQTSLPLNRALYSPDIGEIYDIIARDFFLCTAPPDREHFESVKTGRVLCTNYYNKWSFIYINMDKSI